MTVAATTWRIAESDARISWGEDYGAYLAMLCTPVRCPGPEAYPDAMLFRPLLQAKEVAREAEKTTYSFAQAWRVRLAEIDMHAVRAKMKVDRARKIAVLRDTTLVKHCDMAVDGAWTADCEWRG